MRIVNTLVGIVLSVALIFQTINAQDDCPPCYNNSLRPSLWKVTGSNGQPEEVVTVKIDNSWDDTLGHTNPKIYNAVRTMVDQWNAADPTGPRMVFNQTTQLMPSTRVSVVFKKAKTPLGSYGHSNIFASQYPALPPYTTNGAIEIDLDPSNVGRDDIDIQGTVGHEIGHSVKGLGHPNPELKDALFPMPGTCKDSIMNPGESGNPKRPPDANRVHPRDVEMAKKWRNKRSDCTATAGKELFDTSVGGPTEPVTYEVNTQEATCTIRWKISADFRTDEGILEFNGWRIVIDRIDCF